MYGKLGNSRENSNGTVHPGGNFSRNKVIPFEVLPFSRFTDTTEIVCTICLVNECLACLEAEGDLFQPRPTRYLVFCGSASD